MFNFLTGIFSLFSFGSNNSYSSNWRYGTRGNDVIQGTSASEKIDGKEGNDTIHGGAGNDEIEGGCGNDKLDGGAGSDKVDGGSGDDRLIYNASENAGARDKYDGGSGCDTLVLELTRAEWLRSDVQSDVARFLNYLNDNGNRRGGFCNDFEFKAFCLTVEQIEKLKVVVDGCEINPADECIVAVNDKFHATENGGEITGNVILNDFAPDIIKTIELRSVPAAGVFTFNATNGTFTFDTGTDFEYLSEGQKETVSFKYRITDADGDTSTATTEIVITGKNDRPTISAIDVTGLVTENDATPTLTDSGSISFDDVDACDTISTSVALKSTTTTGPAIEGALATALASAVTIARIGSNDGTVNWGFSLDNDLTQYLAKGETVTATYTITVKDDSGTATNAATQDITITIGGANQQIIDFANGATTYTPPTNADVLGVAYAFDGLTLQTTGTNSQAELVQTARGVGVANVFSTKVNSPEIGGTTEGMRLIFDAPEKSATVKLAFFFESGAQDNAKEYARYAVTYIDENNVQHTTAYTEIVATATGQSSYAASDINLGFYDIHLDSAAIGGKIISLDLEPVQKAGTTSDFFLRSVALNGAGDNILTGGVNDDYITGQAGNDMISGLTGNDSLAGGAGNDILIGGIGNDTLKGGLGNDIFAIANVAEGVDAITDFASGTDKIQVSASGFGGGLAAGGAVTLVQAVDWASVVQGLGDGYFINDTSGADAGTLYWDANGGSASDAVAFASLSGNALIQAADFNVTA